MIQSLFDMVVGALDAIIPNGVIEYLRARRQARAERRGRGRPAAE